MKKVLALAVAVTATLGIMPGHAGVVARQSRGFWLGWSAPNGDSVFIMANTYADPITGAVIASYVNVSVSTNLGYAFASGTNVSLTYDPVLLRGEIQATLTSQLNTPLVVDLSFLGTEVNSNLPFTAVEVAPGGPSVGAVNYNTRNGRTNGSASSSIGVITVTEARANATQYTELTIDDN